MERARTALGAISLTLGCLLSALPLPGRAAPPPPAGEQRYEGPRLSFQVPSGAKVVESSDVAADHAVEVILPAGASLAGVSFRVLVSNSKVSEADVEGVATAWRDARLRNRASWGVRAQGERHTEQSQVGSRRFLRFADQLGSVLGAARQLMMCGSVNARLVCAVASGPAAKENDAEALIVRILETVAVRKKTDPR